MTVNESKQKLVWILITRNLKLLPVSSFLCWLLDLEELLSVELGVPLEQCEVRCKTCDARSEISNNVCLNSMKFSVT